MNGGKKIIGLWRNHPAEDEVDLSLADAHAANVATHQDAGASEGAHLIEDDVVTEIQPISETYPAPDFEPSQWEEEPSLPADPFWHRAAGPVLGFLALAWVGFFGWTLFSSGVAEIPFASWPAVIAQAAIPLALLATLYIMLQRSSYVESKRYASIADKMALQSRHVEEKIAGLNTYLITSRTELANHADEVTDFGLKTAERLQEAAQHIRDSLNDGLSASNQLTDNSVRAMQQVEGLLAGLPKIEDVTTRLTESLREAGRSAHQHGSVLEAQIASLNDQSENVSQVLGRRSNELRSQLADIAEHMAVARRELEESVDTATVRFAESGEAAEAAFLSARNASDTHTTAYLSQLDQAHERLNAQSENLLGGLLTRLADADNAVAALTERVQAQEAHAQSLTMQLLKALQEIDTEFASFDTQGRERISNLVAAMHGLNPQIELMTSKVQLGADGTSQLIGRSEDLLLALDSVTRELEESLPSAFGRLDERLSSSKKLLDLVAPELEKSEAVAEATLGRLREADQLATSQSRLLLEASEASEKATETQRSTLAELNELITNIHAESDRLSEQAGPRLVEALVRVRETATQASEKARQALAGVIPESAERLGDASAEALTAAIGTKVDAQLAEIERASVRATTVADMAAKQLAQQMTALSDASTRLDKHINDSAKTIEEAGRDNLTRRVTLLIESLNSTAIDVTKILSNEVTDTMWESYLKGDRGVFTRRAVRLIDNSESREIMRHYDSDMEFREHVNRYIHDFEAILRNLLGTRDGSALSVAMLSSDMGKLYVILAQAIERLRT